MYKTSIKQFLILVLSTMVLTGCSTTKDSLLTHGDNTILDVWEAGTGGSMGSHQSRQLMDARQSLRRPLSNADIQAHPVMQATYTRSAQTEIYSQFQRLPNPDLVMYVFAHLAGTDPVPVPGYTTVFPFYQRVQYAMPGERTEAY
jgi:conjugative transfer region lipoprotein (TIGR03751 family)